jgi:hypothetical protein
MFTSEDEIGFVDISVNVVFKVNYSGTCTIVLSELSLTDVYQVILSIFRAASMGVTGMYFKGGGGS